MTIEGNFSSHSSHFLLWPIEQGYFSVKAVWKRTFTWQPCNPLSSEAQALPPFSWEKWQFLGWLRQMPHLPFPGLYLFAECNDVSRDCMWPASLSLGAVWPQHGPFTSYACPPCAEQTWIRTRLYWVTLSLFFCLHMWRQQLSWQDQDGVYTVDPMPQW